MRAVVLEDRVVVRVDEEVTRRAEHYRRRLIGFRNRLAVRKPDTQFVPSRGGERNRHVAKRLAAARPRGDVGANPPRDLGRHLDLAAPRRFPLPSVSFEVVRDGSEYIAGRGPDVAAAVAVVVLGVL